MLCRVHASAQKEIPKVLYRGLGPRDLARLLKGLPLQAANPSGDWTPEEHVQWGSSASKEAERLMNDPWISVSGDWDIAISFAKNGTSTVAIIDMTKVTSEVIPVHASIGMKITNVMKNIYDGQVNPHKLYQTAVWQNEYLVKGYIPNSAISVYEPLTGKWLKK